MKAMFVYWSRVWVENDSFKKANMESGTTSQCLLLGHLYINDIYGQRVPRSLSCLVHWTNAKCFLHHMETLNLPYKYTENIYLQQCFIDTDPMWNMRVL